MTKEIRCELPLKDEEGNVIGKAEVTKSGMIYGTITDGLRGVYRPEKFGGVSIGPFDIADVTGFDKDSGHPGFEAWKKANKSPIVVSPIEVVRERIGEIPKSFIVTETSNNLTQILEELRGEITKRVEALGIDPYRANLEFVENLLNNSMTVNIINKPEYDVNKAKYDE